MNKTWFTTDDGTDIRIITKLLDVDQDQELKAIVVLSEKATTLLGSDPETLVLPAEQVLKAGEILARLRTGRTRLDAIRVKAKAPSFALGKAIDAEAKVIKASLDRLIGLLEPAIVISVDPEAEHNKVKGDAQKMVGTLGSKMSVEFIYKFHVKRIQDVPEKYLIDADKRVKWGELRKHVLAAAQDGNIPRNIPGFRLERTGAVKTHTKAQVA